MASILAAVPAIVYAFEAKPPYRVTFLGGAIESQLGYTRAEVLADPCFWIGHVHPDDMRLLPTPQELLQVAVPRPSEYRVRHKNGSYRWVRDDVSIVRDADGTPLEVVGSRSDVTDRRQVEDALRLSEDRYEALFGDDLAGIFLSSVDGRLVACNIAYARICGFESIDEAMDAHLEVLYDTVEDRQQLLQEVRTHKRLAAYRARLRRRDGSPVHIVANIVGIFGAEGQLNAMKGYLFDDSARAAAEEDRRQSEHQYRELFDNAYDVVFTIDREFRFTSVNRAGEVLSGYTRDEALGLTIDAVLPADEQVRVRYLLAELAEGRGAALFEVQLLTRGGRRVPPELSARPLSRDGQVIGFQAIARDVSERQHLEAQVRQAQKLESVGRLAAGVAHDFNNLLTVINGYAELLAVDAAPGVAAAADLRQIAEAGRRAAGLTRQLLAFSRRRVVSPTVIDLNAVVTGMQVMIGRLIGEDVELRLVLQPGVHRVLADQGLVEQVLMNLVVNARDAMPKGGRLTVRTRSVTVDDGLARTVPAVAVGRVVVLSVADNGMGMTDATRERIFEPLFTTKDEGKGTGLGLSTVLEIVKQSNGRICVNSKVGVGTVFELYFPESTDAVHDQVRFAPPRTPAGHETILLVEDDEHVRDFAARILRQAGYHVISIAAPAEAGQRASTADGPIDLLLTDVVLPGIDGRTLADQLCAGNAALRVLFVSGYTSDTVSEHGVLEQALNFLGKPFSANTLLAKVRAVLDSAP